MVRGGGEVRGVGPCILVDRGEGRDWPGRGKVIGNQEAAVHRHSLDRLNTIPPKKEGPSGTSWSLAMFRQAACLAQKRPPDYIVKVGFLLIDITYLHSMYAAPKLLGAQKNVRRGGKCLCAAHEWSPCDLGVDCRPWPGQITSAQAVCSLNVNRAGAQAAIMYRILTLPPH